jgi:opacity protein-like surface antigen
MKNDAKRIAAGLAAALLLASAVGAQQGAPSYGEGYGRIYSGSSYYGNTVSDDLYSDPMEPQQTEGQVRLQGEIQSLQTRSINNRRMVVAQIRTQDNRTVPVLLGSPDRLDRLNLRQGDPVTVIGQRVRLNDRPALKAERIRADGESMRTGQAYSRSEGRRSPTMQVSGTIEDIQQVKIFGQPDLHAVAAVSSENGRIRVVDLGPRSQLGRLGLQKGDRLQVRGERGSINNNPVVAARQVVANGESVSIRRTWNRNDFRVKGRVTDTQTASIRGTAHLIATVRTDEGRRVMVDLGPQSRLREKDISISRGQSIILIAQPSRSGGPMLEATKISIDDRVMQRSI